MKTKKKPELTILTKEDLKWYRKNRSTKLTWSLFNYKWYNWRNLKDVKIFIQRIFFTLKHGYTPVAEFETESYLTDMLIDVMISYRLYRHGNGVMVDENGTETVSAEKFYSGSPELHQLAEKNNQIYDKIIVSLIRSNTDYWRDVIGSEYDFAKDMAYKNKQRAQDLITKNIGSFWD